MIEISTTIKHNLLNTFCNSSLGDHLTNELAAQMPKMPGDGAGQLAEWVANLEPDERELMRLRVVEELSSE